MIWSFISIVHTAYLSLRHSRRLHLNTGEFCTLLRKSANLSLCYRGFSFKSDIRTATGISHSAFCCSAYDLVTDGRDFDKASIDQFESILSDLVNPDLQNLALTLIEKEVGRELGDDGLSRGIDALQFVLRCVGSECEFSRYFDVTNIGILMQIVDDVLDLEEDTATGDLNCLNTARRDGYLNQLLAFNVNDFSMHLPHAFVLVSVIRRAQHKAMRLAITRTVQPPNIESKPHKNVPDKYPKHVAGEIDEHPEMVN